jgi:hypothetical protein
MPDQKAHVFISYVRENLGEVSKLYEFLTMQGVQVWLDRHSIAAGLRWKQATRRAIRDGCFFVACFSKEYYGREKTFMNEELAVAIDELRKRSVESAWFIPIKLNDCEIPDMEIRAGESLRDIQHISFYEDYESALRQLLAALQEGGGAVGDSAPRVGANSPRAGDADHLKAKFKKFEGDTINVTNVEGAGVTAPDGRAAHLELEVEEGRVKTLNLTNRRKAT